MNFALPGFSEVDIPALCVALLLCGRNSYVEIKGSWLCLHKTLSGVGRWNRANFAFTEFSEVRIQRILGSSASDQGIKHPIRPSRYPMWALIAVILLPCNTFVLLEKLVYAATGFDLANVREPGDPVAASSLAAY